MVFLGIDGGGSKTAFILENSAGEEICRVETGPSNWLSAGKESAQTNIAEGISQLGTIPDVICGGFAGAGRPEGIQFYEDCLRQAFPNARVLVETDAFIAYVGANGLNPGILLIAGTGSIAIGRRIDGTMIRVGGWGPIFSDEGSGFSIGREAIRSALRAHDSGSWEFATSISAALKLESITEVSAAWKSGELSVQSVASLAALLFSQYPSEPSNHILHEAGNQLCALADTAITQLGIPDCRRSVAGSVGSHPLIMKLLRSHTGREFQIPAHSPEHGAIMWARSQVHH